MQALVDSQAYIQALVDSQAYKLHAGPSRQPSLYAGPVIGGVPQGSVLDHPTSWYYPMWWNQIQCMPLCCLHHSLLHLEPRSPLTPHNCSLTSECLNHYHGDLGGRCPLTERNVTNWLTKKRKRIPSGYTLHNQTPERAARYWHSVPWNRSRDDREPPLGETHLVCCC